MRELSGDLLTISNFPASLWAKSGPLQRSKELTPLYAERYTGPRLSSAALRHPFWEMSIVVRGQGSLRYESSQANADRDHARAGENSMSANTTFLIPPRVRHAEHAKGTVDTIWIGLSGTRVDGLGAQTPLIATVPALVPLAEQLWLLAERQWGICGAELDALTMQVFARFMSAINDSATPDRDCIDQAVQYVQRHFPEPLSVGELANRFGYSEGHFHRCFRKRTSLTPIQFITRLRMNRAMQALRKSTQCIDAVARSVGYADALYFTRVFRKYTGISPTEFRAKG